MNPTGHTRAILINGALGVVLLAIGLTAYLVLDSGGSAAATTTRTALVQRGTVLATVSASGTVGPSQSAAANFTTSGTVSQIDVSVGQHVAKGQVLARVDPSIADAQLAQAQASLTAADDSLTAAEAAQTTADQAASTTTTTGGSGTGSSTGSSASGSTGSSGGGSTESPDQAAANVASAQAQVDSAQIAVDQAEQTVNGTVLRAPINGTVTAINGTVGGSSSATGSTSSSGSGSSGSSGSGTGSDAGSGAGTGSASSGSAGSSSGTSGFVAIADLGTLQLTADFSETDATSIRTGQPASVTFDALPNVTATGKVTAVSPTPTTVSNVVDYPVTISLPHPPAGLRDGETATAVVVTAAASDVLYVPSAAVTSTGAGSTVTVVHGTKQTVTPVQVGIQGATTTEIRSGVTQGERVVLSVSSSSLGTGGFPFGGGGGGGGGGFLRALGGAGG